MTDLSPDAPSVDTILDRYDGPDEAPAEPTPEAPPEAPSPEVTPEPAPEVDPADGLAALPEWAQKEIRERRDSENKYRLRARSYETAFDGFADEDRDVLLEFASLIRTDPAAAAVRAQEIAQALTAEEIADAQQGMTPETVEQIVERRLAEREAKAAEASAIADITSQAEKLGYKADTEGFARLLWRAHNETNGDLAKADAAIKADQQKIIDEFLASKAREADQTPGMVPATGSAPSAERDITTLSRDERRDAVEAFLAGQK